MSAAHALCCDCDTCLGAGVTQAPLPVKQGRARRVNPQLADSVIIGGRVFPLVENGEGMWVARDLCGLYVHHFSRRSWRIAIGVAGLSVMAYGATLTEAEKALDEKLEPIRLLIGVGT